ncbi:MAG: hypothetical protein AB8G14_05205 [Ilumatobacter sp.]
MVQVVLVASVLVGLGACSGSDRSEGISDDAPVDAAIAPDVPAPQYVLDVRNAVEAVEAELGGPQRYFEVTSNAQFTNVFVALDDATAAVAYAFVDGELEPPAPRQEGASGDTFAASDIDFVDDRLLSGVTADLPDSQIDAISVYGNGFGATYVVAATSAAGGFLDIVVGPNGAVFSVDPV